MRLVLLVVWLLCSIVVPASAQCFMFVFAPGQSNDSGPGTDPPQGFPTYTHPNRIKTYGYGPTLGAWVTATDPVGPSGGGLGSSMAFADRMIALLDANPGTTRWVPGVGTIGILMGAQGGSSTADWMPMYLQTLVGVRYYGGVLKAVQEARAGCTLKGMLPYIGESDAKGLVCGNVTSVPVCRAPANGGPTGTEIVLTFIERMMRIITQYRLDWETPNLPVIITGIGPNPAVYNSNGTFPFWGEIQAGAINAICDMMMTHIKCVSAADLTGNFAGFDAHLTPASQLILGVRRADAMYSLLQ